MESENINLVLGLDIHPDSFSATLIEGTNNKNSKILLSHKTIDIFDLEKWLSKHIPTDTVLVIESGSNSFEFCKIVKALNYSIIVLESYSAGKIGEAYLKNDIIDSEKIARIYLTGLAKIVWQPDELTRQRREIYQRYKNAVKDSTRTKTRIRSWLSEHRLKAPTGLSLTKKEGKSWVKKSYQWTALQNLIIESMFDDLYHSEIQRKRLRGIIIAEVSNTPQMAKLMQLCGIRAITAYALVAYIGDIARFANAKKLVSYFGLNPRVSDSGKNVRRGRISKCGRKEVRALLTQCAHSIFRSKSNPKLRSWGKHLSFRKGQNIAVTAVARKLTVAVWYVLKNMYTPLTEATNSLKVKVRKISSETGKDTLASLGYEKTKVFQEKLLKVILYGT